MALMVKMLASAEVIRDGGSLAASFCDERGAKWILFLRLRRAVGEGEVENLGFEKPVLINAATENRPNDTPDRTHSILSGPSVPLSWQEAQALVTQFMTHSAMLSETAQRALSALRIAMDCEGELPPGMERLVSSFKLGQPGQAGASSE
jgi:hypothetical protein